jgi:hypothetical protein
VEEEDSPLRRLGLGEPRGCGAATYRRGAEQGTWTAGMQRRPAGCITTAAMCGATALWRRHQQKGQKGTMTMATSS